MKRNFTEGQMNSVQQKEPDIIRQDEIESGVFIEDPHEDEFLFFVDFMKECVNEIRDLSYSTILLSDRIRAIKEWCHEHSLGSKFILDILLAEDDDSDLKGLHSYILELTRVLEEIM